MSWASLGSAVKIAGNIASAAKDVAHHAAEKAKGAIGAVLQDGYTCPTAIICDETVPNDQIHEAVAASLELIGDISVSDEELEIALEEMRGASSGDNDEGGAWWTVTENVYARIDEGTGLVAVRLKMDMANTTPEKVFHRLFHPDGRTEWDKNVSEVSLILAQGDTEVRYEVFQWPRPLWNRDNVARLRVQRTPHALGTNIAVLCETITDPRVPAAQDRVRCWGRTICSLQPNEDGSCTLQRLTVANPNGSIPAVVVNRTAPQLASGWIQKFTASCE